MQIQEHEVTWGNYEAWAGRDPIRVVKPPAHVPPSMPSPTRTFESAIVTAWTSTPTTPPSCFTHRVS